MSNPFQKNTDTANIFNKNTQNSQSLNPQSNQQAQGNHIFQNNQNNNPSNSNSTPINNAFTGNASKPSGGTAIFNNFNAPPNNNSSAPQNAIMNNLNKPNVPSSTGQTTNLFTNPIQNAQSPNNIFQNKPTQNNQAPSQGNQIINQTNQKTPPANSNGSVNPLAILSSTSGTNLIQAISNQSSGPTLNLTPNQNNQNSNQPVNIFNKNILPNTNGTAANQQNQQGQTQNQSNQPQQNTNNAQQGNNMANLFNMNKNTTGTGGTNSTGGTGTTGGVGGVGTTNNTQSNQSGNIFNNAGNNNLGANQNSQGNNTGQNTTNQVQGANQQQNNNTNTNNNGTNLFSNNNTSNNTGLTAANAAKDNYEIQFDKSNQTIEELIEEFKTNLKNSYEELKKLGEKTIKFLDERQDFIKIQQHFTEVEKMLVGNSQDILKSLDNLQRQQRDILQQVDGISRKIGEGQYTHQLTTTLQQYSELKKRVIELHQQEGEWKDPGHEQLINLFDSLNQVEMQVKEMDQLVDVYLAHS